jgi:hypothetical protein
LRLDRLQLLKALLNLMLLLWSQLGLLLLLSQLRLLLLLLLLVLLLTRLMR